MNDPLLLRLRNETRLQHEQTESLMYADKLMTGTLTRTEYEHLLQVHYLFHQALEKRVAELADFFVDYDWMERRKTPWLVADLQAAGIPLPDARSELFAGWNGYQLLGALYVAEGSTLGGRVIAKALSQIPELLETVGPSQFFGGYGAETGSRWKAFGSYLTSHSNNHDNQVVEAAGHAFELFGLLMNTLQQQAPVRCSSFTY